MWLTLRTHGWRPVTSDFVGSRGFSASHFRERCCSIRWIASGVCFSWSEVSQHPPAELKRDPAHSSFYARHVCLLVASLCYTMAGCTMFPEASIQLKPASPLHSWVVPGLDPVLERRRNARELANTHQPSGQERRQARCCEGSFL